MRFQDIERCTNASKRSNLKTVDQKKLISQINFWTGNKFQHESLILAQDERWRRAEHMQVERSTLFDFFGMII